MVGIKIMMIMMMVVTIAIMMMMTMTYKLGMFAHSPHVSVRLELIKISRKTREKQANLTKTRF